MIDIEPTFLYILLENVLELFKYFSEHHIIVNTTFNHIEITFSCVCLFSLFCSVQMESPPRVMAAASVLKDLCYKNREELQAGFMTAGWDNKNGPQVGDLCENCQTSQKS